jgi:hypothetical protein
VVLEQNSVSVSTWGEWKAAHPNTTIVAEDGGIGRSYEARPARWIATTTVRSSPSATSMTASACRSRWWAWCSPTAPRSRSRRSRFAPRCSTVTRWSSTASASAATVAASSPSSTTGGRRPRSVLVRLEPVPPRHRALDRPLTRPPARRSRLGISHPRVWRRGGPTCGRRAAGCDRRGTARRRR